MRCVNARVCVCVCVVFLKSTRARIGMLWVCACAKHSRLLIDLCPHTLHSLSGTVVGQDDDSLPSKKGVPETMSATGAEAEEEGLIGVGVGVDADTVVQAGNGVADVEMTVSNSVYVCVLGCGGRGEGLL